jgi:hypothetical protein
MTDLFNTFASVVMPDLARESIVSAVTLDELDFPIKCEWGKRGGDECRNPAVYMSVCPECSLMEPVCDACRRVMAGPDYQLEFGCGHQCAGDEARFIPIAGGNHD